MEEDGFEVVAGPSQQQRSARAEPFQLGALVLQLGGEKKRVSLGSSDPPEPALMSARNTPPEQAQWKPYDYRIAKEQAGLAWTTVDLTLNHEGEVKERSAGKGQEALSALRDLVRCKRARAAWIMEEVEETAQRRAHFKLIVRVAMWAENDEIGDDDGAEAGAGDLSQSAIRLSTDGRLAQDHRKHFLYALRADVSTHGEQTPSIAEAFRADPVWLLQDSEADQTMTLRDVYNSMPPPSSEQWNNVSDSLRATVRKLVAGEERIPGIRAELYRFQRSTVAKLLRRELDIRPLPDPRMVKISTRQGRKAYIDTKTFTLHRQRTCTPDVSGSILSEHMGLGKTLECITLIMLTRGQRAMINPPGQVFPEPEGVEAPEHSFLCTPSFLVQERDNPREARRPLSAPTPIRMFRTATTLICVPMELLRQWMDQLEEHLEVKSTPKTMGKDDGTVFVDGEAGEEHDIAEIGEQFAAEDAKPPREGALRILVLLGNIGETPSAAEIATYDIVLLSSRRLGAEYRKCDVFKTRSTGVPRASFGTVLPQEQKVSPLLQCLFRRLIIDEGHFLGGKSRSQLMDFTKVISTQSRLMVSGTPASKLVGRVHEDIGRKFSGSAAAAREWTQSDADDLDRIRLMLENFFLHPTFIKSGATDSHVDWKKDIIGPLNVDKDTLPDFGAVQRIRQLFNSLFVKAGDEAREEVQLPPCNDNIVKLKMNASEARMHNMVQALICLNKVSRTDMHLLDDGQEEYASRAAFNVRRSTLWFDSFEFTEEAIWALEVPERLIGGTDEDRAQQRQALKYLQSAIDDDQTLGRVGMSPRYFSSSIHQSIAPIWTSRIPKNQDFPLNFNGPSIWQIREMLKNLKELKVAGETLLDRIAEYPRGQTALLVATLDDVQDDEGLECDTLRDDPKEINKSKSGSKWNIVQIKEGTVVPSALQRTKIESVSSTKLAWILDYIKAMSPDDKTIIFSDMESVRHLIVEALEVAQIQYVRHGPEIPKRSDRFVALREFKTEAKTSVIVMDLIKGGRGLNLQVANHIIFVEPVWDLALEIQALKRAHRLGQRKPVHVHTLVMRGTFEEDVIRRRRDVDLAEVRAGGGTGRSADVQDKRIDREVLQASRYVVDHTPLLYTKLQQPLYPLAHTRDGRGTPLVGATESGAHGHMPAAHRLSRIAREAAAKGTRPPPLPIINSNAPSSSATALSTPHLNNSSGVVRKREDFEAARDGRPRDMVEAGPSRRVRFQ